MIYLTSSIWASRYELPQHLGWMITQREGQKPDGRIWAADNGCFASGQTFDLGRYLSWLEGLPHRERCLFATAPDVLGDARATLERSIPVLPMLRELGYRAAFVGQDGLEASIVPWDAFDCLFIGGSTRWKLSEATYSLIANAKDRGKWVHVGRVNSWRRFRAMAIAGADSVDGTHIRFEPDVSLANVRRWMNLQGHVGFLTKSA